MDELTLSLIVVGIFFLVLYIYAYGTDGYQERKQKKRRLKQQKLIEAKEAKINAEIKGRLTKLNEKYKVTQDRSEQIKRELEELEQWNKEHLRTDNYKSTHNEL